MSQQILVLCVEDEQEVRDAIVRDLEPFSGYFQVEAAEDATAAQEVLGETLSKGGLLGLALCDHLLPGETGVDFLVELNKDSRTAAARKVLITGQARLEDTIRAVNEAGLDNYIAKPWKREELQEIVKKQLTEFVLANVEDLLPYVNVLDGVRLLEEVRNRKSDT